MTRSEPEEFSFLQSVQPSVTAGPSQHLPGDEQPRSAPFLLLLLLSMSGGWVTDTTVISSLKVAKSDWPVVLADPGSCVSGNL